MRRKVLTLYFWIVNASSNVDVAAAGGCDDESVCVFVGVGGWPADVLPRRDVRFRFLLWPLHFIQQFVIDTMENDVVGSGDVEDKCCQWMMSTVEVKSR